MNLRTGLLTLLLITGISFQNCTETDCDCCIAGDIPQYFDIQDLQVRHAQANFQDIETDAIPFEDYGFINVHFQVDYVVLQHDEQKLWSPFNFSLINSAYGCSFLPSGYKGSKEESIESFDVITVNDFDEEHRAGDSINDLLELDLRNVEIALAQGPIILEEFLASYSGNVPSEYFFLKLLKEPTLDNDFQIRLVTTLSTGESYEEVSSVITLL